MIGMNLSSGASLAGDAHLAQSIADILTTPIGSRVMRRDYGSLLFALVDAPINAATRLRFIAATAMALARWEPRLRVTRVDVKLDEEAGGATGTIAVNIEGERTDTPAPNSFIRLTLPLRFGRGRAPA